MTIPSVEHTPQESQPESHMFVIQPLANAEEIHSTIQGGFH